MKQLRSYFIINRLFLVLGAIVLIGCQRNNESQQKPPEKLVIYTPNTQSIIKATVPAFEEKYGVKVQLVQGSTGDLMQKLKKERHDPVADVFFGGNYTQFENDKELFQPYVSKAIEQVIKEYRDPNGIATPYTINGSVLIINKNLTKGVKIEGYDDLINPELKGKIAYGNPNNSSSAFSQLTNILIAKGGYDSPEAWGYLKQLLPLIEGKIANNSSEVYESVANGSMSVGLTYEDPSLKLVNSGADILIVYPKEGTVFTPSSAGIVKGAKHVKNAKRFIDFIISKVVQDGLGESTTNRPVRYDAKTNNQLRDLKTIPVISEDYHFVTKNKKRILKKYTALFKS